MLKLQNISKVFPSGNEKIVALKDISLEVNEGEFLVVIGPSGCGKSTILRIIAGLEYPTSGQVVWIKKEKISFVFQHFALFPYLTVFENIEFGLKMEGVQIHQRKQIVNELIEEVGLVEFSNKRPRELSGGMQQRVGIARSLSISPNVLLMDEPFSSLDEFTAETLRKLLLQIWHKRQMTVIMVTHSIGEAIELSDRIAVMSPAPGNIEKIITNNLPRSRNLRSKDFFALEDTLKREIRF